MQELQAQLQQAQAAAKAQPTSTAVVTAPGLALEVTGADGDAAMQDMTGEGHQQELQSELHQTCISQPSLLSSAS